MDNLDEDLFKRLRTEQLLAYEKVEMLAFLGNPLAIDAIYNDLIEKALNLLSPAEVKQFSIVSLENVFVQFGDNLPQVYEDCLKFYNNSNDVLDHDCLVQLIDAVNDYVEKIDDPSFTDDQDQNRARIMYLGYALGEVLCSLFGEESVGCIASSSRFLIQASETKSSELSFQNKQLQKILLSLPKI